MFGTSIHWTTFFYLLIDSFIVAFTSYQSIRFKRSSLKRYITLGILFIIYNASGGFLPIESQLIPMIIQHILTYGLAIITCVYLVFYLYKEYDIEIIQTYWSIMNISLLVILGFILLFIVPYLYTESLRIARMYFTVPISLLCFFFLGLFKRHINTFPKTNQYISRRHKLSTLSVACVALLPLLTLIGDYQWLTFTIMNLSFYAITVIEIDRYLYFLENKNRMFEMFDFFKKNKQKLLNSKLIYQSLTRRELEVALSILNRKTYNEIGKDFFIAERTVSKHASNIFKKTGVKNKKAFLSKFERK